ncbi:uncharacterized [Tachysurus ichikawai]
MWHESDGHSSHEKVEELKEDGERRESLEEMICAAVTISFRPPAFSGASAGLTFDFWLRNCDSLLLCKRSQLFLLSVPPDSELQDIQSPEEHQKHLKLTYQQQTTELQNCTRRRK